MKVETIEYGELELDEAVKRDDPEGVCTLRITATLLAQLIETESRSAREKEGVE